MTYWYPPGPQEKCRTKYPCRLCAVLVMFGRPMAHPCCARLEAQWVAGQKSAQRNAPA
jgi:hypothetical protein